MLHTPIHHVAHTLSSTSPHCLGPQTLEYFQKYAPAIEGVEASANPAEYIVDLTTKVYM